MRKQQSISVILLVGISLLGMVRPLLQSQIVNHLQLPAETEWPSHFMGKLLIPIPLTEGEESFYQGFPGQAAQFEGGGERLILRRVQAATRKLHPAKDCFKGIGYSIGELGLVMDAYEQIWRIFRATKENESLEVLEMISDNHGNTWSDVSTWYWAVLLRRTQGPWTSYVRIRKI